MSSKPIQLRLSEQNRQAAEIAAYWRQDNLSEFCRNAIEDKAAKTFRVEMRDSEMLVFFSESGGVTDDGVVSTSVIESLTDTLSAFNFPADWVCVEVNRIAHEFYCARFKPNG